MTEVEIIATLAARLLLAYGLEDVLCARSDATVPVVWEIGPTETLVVMTAEEVKMPLDLCASYAPLHRLAQQGVMLLNASIVEPGYEGPLSCFLVNFSSERVSLRPFEEVAKITFHTMKTRPNLRDKPIPSSHYRTELAKSAKKFHKSFRDISGIADRVAEKAQGVTLLWQLKDLNTTRHETP